MKLRCDLPLLLACALGVTSLNTVRAEVISLNFVRASDGAAALDPLDVAGVVAVANWNNAPQANANSNTGFVLLDDTGLDSGATADWLSGGASWSVATAGTGEAGDKIMMTGYLDQSGNGVGQIHTITVYDIPFAQYDVYLYHSSSGGPNRTARYQANTIDIFTRNLDPANTFDGFTNAGYDTIEEAADTANPAGNYVLWQGLTDATLAIEAEGIPTSAGGNGGETVRSPIQGIQIVDTTPGLPVVENLEATLVSPDSATVNGDLISNGDDDESAALTFYYGPDDGGTDPLAWADSADAGSLTAPGTFSADLIGLTSETTYYFRAFASNSTGDAWAVASGSFTTLRLPELPDVENLEATDMTTNSATANGNLISNGLDADNTELTIYWGPEDGGTDPLAWANSAAAGSLNAPGAFSADLTGLASGTLYYYRAFALNSAGGVWAPASQSFGTLFPAVEVISLNFVRASNGATALAPGEAAGFIKSGNWNNAPQANANGMTGLALLNGSGADSGATADWQSGGASWSVATAGAGSAADMKMMTGYLDQGGNGAGQIHTITVHNVPYPNYNVYLYHSSSGGPNRTARFQANTIDLFTRNIDPANTFDGWVNDQHPTLEASNSSAGGGNYVVWEGLSGSTLAIEAEGISASEGGFPGSGETRRAPIQGIQIVPAPGIELRIATSGSDLVFSWDSEDGKLYNLHSETDLAAGSPGDWPVYGNYMDIPATPPENTLTIPRPEDPQRFFAIAQFNAPPESVFSEDFENGQGGWTTGFDDAGGSTLWELGAPSNVGPTAAHGGTNCYGTNIAADYGIEADTWLRSPAINLIDAEAATLSFHQFRDIEAGFDIGTLRVLDATDDSELAVLLNTVDGISTDWEQVTAGIPAAALGKMIKLEFRLDTDDVGNFAGWYIDDINVTVP